MISFYYMHLIAVSVAIISIVVYYLGEDNFKIDKKRIKLNKKIKERLKTKNKNKVYAKKDLRLVGRSLTLVFALLSALITILILMN